MFTEYKEAVPVPTALRIGLWEQYKADFSFFLQTGAVFMETFITLFTPIYTFKIHNLCICAFRYSSIVLSLSWTVTVKGQSIFLCILFGQFCLATVHKVNTHWGQVNIERNAWKCHFVLSSVYKSVAQNKYDTRANRCPMASASPHNKTWQRLRFILCEDCDAFHKMSLILHLYRAKLL